MSCTTKAWSTRRRARPAPRGSGRRGARRSGRQLTTDGHKVYLEVVEGAFGPNIDDAMLIKMYEGDGGVDGTAERRYTARCLHGSREQTITPRSIA